MRSPVLELPRRSKGRSHQGHIGEAKLHPARSPQVGWVGRLRYRRNSAVNCCAARPTNSQRLLNFCIWIGQGDL